MVLIPVPCAEYSHPLRWVRLYSPFVMGMSTVVLADFLSMSTVVLAVSKCMSTVVLTNFLIMSTVVLAVSKSMSTVVLAVTKFMSTVAPTSICRYSYSPSGGRGATVFKMEFFHVKNWFFTYTPTLTFATRCTSVR